MFVVVDIETTGVDPDEDAIVEIGACAVEDGAPTSKMFSSLVRSRVPIKVEASAVHHIIDEDLVYAPEIGDVIADLWTELNPIYVAHNAAFEVSFLKSFLPDAKWLCTFKSAKHIWPDAPSYSNQALRYWLKLPVDRQIADTAHRAPNDAYVTAHLLCELLKHATVEQMLEWTNQPVLMRVCPIGEKQGHKGKPWSEVPVDFLDWIRKPKSEPMDPDLVWHATQELKRRSAEADAAIAARLKDEKEARDKYVQLAVFAASQAPTVEDIKKWLNSNEEKQNRERYRVREGTPEFAKIVAACTARKQQLMPPEEAAA